MKRIGGNTHEVYNLCQSLIATITALSGKEASKKTRMSIPTKETPDWKLGLLIDHCV